MPGVAQVLIAGARGVHDDARDVGMQREFMQRELPVAARVCVKQRVVAVGQPLSDASVCAMIDGGAIAATSINSGKRARHDSPTFALVV
jgi:hypothetical protein